MGPGRPTLAGIFLLMAGLVSIAGTVLAGLDAIGTTNSQPITAEEVALELFILTTIAPPIIGGFLCFMRSAWIVALGCAIVGVVNLAFIPFNNILALIGIILLVSSRSLFKS